MKKWCEPSCSTHIMLSLNVIYLFVYLLSLHAAPILQVYVFYSIMWIAIVMCTTTTISFYMSPSHSRRLHLNNFPRFQRNFLCHVSIPKDCRKRQLLIAFLKPSWNILILENIVPQNRQLERFTCKIPEDDINCKKETWGCLFYLILSVRQNQMELILMNIFKIPQRG